MNYYPFHIGDFRSGTVNMSRLMRWIYRDMLDVYYDTEKPLSLNFEHLCNEIGAESEEELRLVERLLRFKFVKSDDGYRNEICDRVIADYRAKAETAKANGKLGGRPRKQSATKEKPSGFPSGSDRDADGNPDGCGSQTNQQPVTKNQEPGTNPPIAPEGAAGSGDDIAGDYVAGEYVPSEPHELGVAGGGGGSNRMAGAVCLMAKSKGMYPVNPGNAKLIALLNAGTPISSFEGAIQKCVDSGKPFVYMLGIVEREEKEARDLAVALARPRAQAPAVNGRSDQPRNAAAGRAIFDEEDDFMPSSIGGTQKNSTGEVIDV